jgi:DNA polymerase-3 subunit alpha
MNIQNTGFAHLHLHTTEGSLLDGYGFSREYAEKAKQMGQKYLCITDHGMCSAIPIQVAACEENGLIPIFGVELYLNPNQPDMTKITDSGREDLKKLRKSYHILAIAYNNEGYKNIIRLSSEAWLKGFYYRPRVNYEQLEKYKEGIIWGSACFNGEIGQALKNFGPDVAMDKVLQYKEMFGDNFYLELMLLDFHEQKSYNAFLVEAHKKTGIPLNITNDVHYAESEHSYHQRIMLMIATKSTIAELEQKLADGKSEEELFELQDTNLWMKSEDELNQKWISDYQDIIPLEIFQEAKRNTIRICEKAAGVQLDRSNKLPQIENENEKLKELVILGFNKRELPKNRVYLDRLKEELELIKDKGFASYFLIEKMMTDAARAKCPELLGWGSGWEALGPGRGSGAACLINYCLEITDVDPIEHDLLFSRFLSPARGGRSMLCRFRGDQISV